MRKVSLLVLVAAMVVGLGLGCGNSASYRQRPRSAMGTIAMDTRTVLPDPLIGPAGDVERNKEVELVEQMAQYRASYEKNLQTLLEFYNKQGNHVKAGWVEEEIKYLKSGPRRQYLILAEVASPDLRALRAIPEADSLYEKGLEMVRQGRSMGGLVINKPTLYLAIDKFNELITSYSDSDRIDEAAFEVGEIYRLYMKDYVRALQYYQRVRQWDPKTPCPVSYSMARIYDDHYNNRAKAIKYYEEVIYLEATYMSNVSYARNRMEYLNKEIKY